MSIRSFIKKVEIVDVEAPLPTILEKLSKDKALGVVESGRLVGLILEERAISLIKLTGLSQQLKARDLMITDIPIIREDTPFDLLAYLLDSHPYPAVPVIGDDGYFLGLIFKRDLMRYILGSFRPRTLGGMATPLGVYLTTGSLRAGASDLGLFLTGSVFAILILIAIYLTDGLAYLVQLYTPLPLYAIKNSPPIGIFNPFDFLYYLMGAFELGLFLLFLRISPLSSYHGAEHKVVNTIESGEVLELEVVRRMPKEHPRCGTNLAVFLLLTFLIYQISKNIFLALIIPLLSWRYLGMIVQRYITTKEPPNRYLLNAIEAGRELLKKFREAPYLRPSVPQRIYNMGILHIIAGYSLIFAIYQIVLFLAR
jgi:CBS domain-containing protein